MTRIPNAFVFLLSATPVSVGNGTSPSPRHMSNRNEIRVMMIPFYRLALFVTDSDYMGVSLLCTPVNPYV